MPEANCITLSGYALDCRDTQGGIKSIFIAEHSDVTGITDNGSGTVTAVTPTGTTFYEYEVYQESSSYSENPVPSLENGTIFYTHSLSFMIKINSAAVRTEIAALAQGQLMVIVQLNQTDDSGNPVYKLLGRENGLYMTSNSTGGSGQAFGDMNGWSLEFEGSEPKAAFFVDSTIISDIT